MGGTLQRAINPAGLARLGLKTGGEFRAILPFTSLRCEVGSEGANPTVPHAPEELLCYLALEMLQN
jgi:hypothetical protein